MVTSLVFGVASALSPDYWWYAVLRALTGAWYTGGLGRAAPSVARSMVNGAVTRWQWLAAVVSSLERGYPSAGFGNSGIGIICFVLAVEPVGPSWRGTCGIFQVGCSCRTSHHNLQLGPVLDHVLGQRPASARVLLICNRLGCRVPLQGCAFTVGACLLAPMAALVRPWRPLLVFASLPMAAYLLLWPAVHESPRWLLVAGRKVGECALGFWDLVVPQSAGAAAPPLRLVLLCQHPCCRCQHCLRLRLLLLLLLLPVCRTLGRNYGG